jgi:dTDP-4-amino-4,6-dideoxygalactose transaminase
MARPELGEREIAAVIAVLRSGDLAQGREVAAFESEFSHVAVDGAACVAVNSGTSALHLALLAAGIGGGDEVIVPSFTFAATANAVAITGATPIFCDIDPATFCMDPDAVASLVGPRTVAIMPVHLYGCPADMNRILRIADSKGLMVLEDAAQAHLATLDGKAVGTWGMAGTFSFYPTKNMTTGEGGMVTTRDSGLERRVRLLRNQGQEVRYRNEIIGLNNRMTDIQGAIGRVQLMRLRDWTTRRQEIAKRYSAELSGVITPTVPAGSVHVFHQYTIRIVGQSRDHFSDALHARGVDSGIYYPVPVHQLPAYGLALDLPATREVASDCLSLPVRPSLTDEEVGSVIDAVNGVAKVGA